MFVIDGQTTFLIGEDHKFREEDIMKKAYRYQMRVYALYTEFGEKPFYTRTALLAMNKLPLKSTPITYINLLHKGLIRDIQKEEYKEIENYKNTRSYRKISDEGLKIARAIEANKSLITKFLLKL